MPPNVKFECVMYVKRRELAFFFLLSRGSYIACLVGTSEGKKQNFSLVLLTQAQLYLPTQIYKL